MSQYGARRLRRLGRDAFESGQDATDYNLSYTARSFVPYYAQRMSNAIVINGAQGILSEWNQQARCAVTDSAAIRRREGLGDESGSGTRIAIANTGSATPPCM